MCMEIGDLATWLGAIANVAVVIAAFKIQRQGFDHDHRARDHQRAELHVEALQSAKATMQIFDTVIGFKGEPLSDRKRSDVIGRLKVCFEFASYYLSIGIIDSEIVAALIATKSLIDKTIEDIHGVPGDTDLLSHVALTKIYTHRTVLREGVDQMITKAFQRPVRTPPPA